MVRDFTQHRAGGGAGVGHAVRLRGEAAQPYKDVTWLRTHSARFPARP